MGRISESRFGNFFQERGEVGLPADKELAQRPLLIDVVRKYDGMAQLLVPDDAEDFSSSSDSGAISRIEIGVFGERAKRSANSRRALRRCCADEKSGRSDAPSPHHSLSSSTSVAGKRAFWSRPARFQNCFQEKGSSQNYVGSARVIEKRTKPWKFRRDDN